VTVADGDAYDVAVVGGGVAALSSAMFAASFGFRTVVLSEILVGGQIINVEAIGNYPGFPDPVNGAEFAALVEQQAAQAGAEYLFSTVESITPGQGGFEIRTEDGGELTVRGVIVAAGSSLRKLGVPGEAEFDGRGVSYCGSCDGAFFKDKPVAVIGGGDSAADEALVVGEYASQVTIITRSPRLHASASTVARVAEHDKITVITQAEPVEIVGDGTVTGIRVRNVPDQTVAELAVAGVFVYVGLKPNTSLLAPLLQLDPDGRVPTDPAMRTAVPGLYAVGDIRRGFAGYLVNAASDGASAAADIRRYLG
jgi:thioredoxin reductase (NADPH)